MQGKEASINYMFINALLLNHSIIQSPSILFPPSHYYMLRLKKDTHKRKIGEKIEI